MRIEVFERIIINFPNSNVGIIMPPGLYDLDREQALHLIDAGVASEDVHWLAFVNYTYNSRINRLKMKLAA